MISGIKRRSTAIESTFRYFQTVDLIISHFKREADKKKIFELINESPTFATLLNATAAIHLYHYMGVKVHEFVDNNQFSYDSTRNLELKEKAILMDEVRTLLKNSFQLEIDLLYKIINFENLILEFLIDERISIIQETEKTKRIRNIEMQIEHELLEIISKYPPFYFYDFIGDLIGYSNELKRVIMEESSAFKDLSVELEKKLEREEKEDKFIELSTLNRLIKKVQQNFEFRSYKELQIQTMSVRKLKRNILDYEFDRFPISIPGLKSYLQGNELKKKLVKSIEVALNKNTDYDQFESDILSILKLELIEQLKTNPNDFIYFLQSLNESEFNDLIYYLNKKGIYDIMHLIRTDNNLADNVKKNMIRYNITKQDLLNLNDEKKNMINLAKKALLTMNFPFLEKITKKIENISEFNLLKLLYRDNIELQELWKALEERLGFSINDLREFVRKKQIIDTIFFQGLHLNNYSQIILIIDFEHILNNLVKDIFFYLLSKIFRQLGRIIESYDKISNDKTLFLLALKKMEGILETEEWVKIKLEELIIQRLIKRQKELVIVFDANNQVFLVNGFILSRMTDKPLKEKITDLREGASLVYEEIAPLKLKPDLISPVSYCMAYDLIKRFEKFEKARILKVENVLESEKKGKEEKRKLIREKQEESTLNWIERRITSSLMRINSSGINPNQLYWQDKDNKIATDNIKLHCELKGDKTDLFIEYFIFAIEKIKEFIPEMDLPEKDAVVSEIINIIEKVLEERMGHKPNFDEIQNMLDGERFEIAKRIALKIGSLLDKALYYKFKKKQRAN